MEVNKQSIKAFWNSLKGVFSDNVKKNALALLITVAYIILGTLSLVTLVSTFEISLSTFFKVWIICINLPTTIVTSLIFIGKWKGAVANNEMIGNLYSIKLELELKKQEIEHLKLVQQQFATIADLSEKLKKIEQEWKEKLEIQNELWGYKCMVASKDGNVRDAILSNKGWNDSNKMKEIIEESEKPSDAPE